MDRTLENEFFKEFEYSGTACYWLRWVQWKYDLKNKNSIGGISSQAEEKLYDLFLEVTIPQMPQIRETLELSIDDSLYAEIAANLEECKSDEEKERYVGSLIKPFKHYSDICLPLAQVDRLKYKIEKIESCVADIVDLPADEMLVSTSDYTTPVMTVSEQLAQYDKDKTEAEIEIESIKKRTQKFWHIICDSNTPNHSHISECIFAFFSYYSRLDALLLTHYVDLMELQKDYGVYFVEERIMSCVASHIGSVGLTQKYIEEINRRKAQPVICESTLIKNTEPASKRKGRPTQPLRSCLLCDDDKKDDILKLLHQLIDGKKGKNVVLIVIAAQKAGLVTKITYRQASEEFGEIGNEQGYNKYIRDKASEFTEEEITPIYQRLKVKAGLS